MPKIPENNRNQLRITSLDQLIPAEDDARIIDAFVDALDLQSFNFVMKGGKKTGRPAYPIGSLLKLYMLGYRNGIRSSRNLEKACVYDNRFMWLLKELQPKYKTIAEFRRINKSAFKEVFRSFVLVLQSEGLISGETIALDGVHIKAWNSRKNNFNNKKLENQLKYIDHKVETYIDQMDEVDSSEDKEELLQKIVVQKQREHRYKKIKKDLEESGSLQISTTDPESKALAKKMQVEMSYNIQTATDNKNNLITEFTVTNKNDTNALYETSKAAKDLLGVEEMNVLADKGYPTGSELKKCADAHITTYVAPKANGAKNKKGAGFKKSKFKYDSKNDFYKCPVGEKLESNGKWYQKNNGRGKPVYKVKVYKSNFSTCNKCPHRFKCAGASSLKRSQGRQIERSEFEKYTESNAKRIAENRDFYRTRQQIVEHPFGTMKRQWHFGYTLLKKISKVEAEVGIIFICYNLVRTKTILGPKLLIKKLKGMKISINFFTSLILSVSKHLFLKKELALNWK